MHSAYRELMLARAAAAIKHGEAVASIKHPATKGQLREILVRELFRPLLPADIGVGTGHIIDTQNRTSTQQDVILFDRRVLPPVTVESEVGLFPVESVLYTIEVKSKLGMAELRAAHKAAAKLTQFFYAPGHYGENDAEPQNTAKLIPTVFAFRSNLSGNKQRELQRYGKVAGGQPALRALCIVGRGYWFYDDAGWVTPQGRDDLNEVTGFISGILNRYPAIAASRGNPQIGKYLFDD